MKKDWMNNLRGDKNFYPTPNGVKTFILQYYSGLKKLDRNLLTLKFLSNEKVKKDIYI